MRAQKRQRQQKLLCAVPININVEKPREGPRSLPPPVSAVGAAQRLPAAELHLTGLCSCAYLSCRGSAESRQTHFTKYSLISNKQLRKLILKRDREAQFFSFLYIFLVVFLCWQMNGSDVSAVPQAWLICLSIDDLFLNVLAWFMKMYCTLHRVLMLLC